MDGQNPYPGDNNQPNTVSSGSERKNYKQHWDKVFLQCPDEKLGWYETDFSPTFRLLKKSGINKDARILLVGAGSTTLADALVEQGYRHLLATDISEVALNKIKNRLGNKVELLADDLTQPDKLLNIEPVDLWIDRAVLHFFTNQGDQETYFALLHKLVKPGGYVLMAQFNLKGAQRCSGLPVHRYSKEMLQTKLGKEYHLLDSFDCTYTMPSGDKRPYIYALFKRL